MSLFEFEPGTPEWRLAHIRRGDRTMEQIGQMLEDGDLPANIAALAVVAQAHYAAANVRYRSPHP